jgi:hypothetical protein
MSKITDIEDFEDLSRCSEEKLTKLRDRARQYERACREEWEAAKARTDAILSEIQYRLSPKETS